MGRCDRFRSELWSFTYLAVRRVLSLVVLVLRRSGSKEIEILLPSHELEILRRKSAAALPPTGRSGLARNAEPALGAQLQTRTRNLNDR
jgi:hypothetical protein